MENVILKKINILRSVGGYLISKLDPRTQEQETIIRNSNILMNNIIRD